MRLTNDQRDAILRGVVADLPPKVDQTEAVRKRVKEINEAKLPPAILRVARDSALSPYLETGSVYFSGIGSFAVYVTRDSGYHGRWATAYTEDPQVLAFVKATQEADAARDLAVSALRRDLALCTTQEVFRERFPELAKYLPVTVAATVKTLPATTATLDALAAAGWKADNEAA